MATLWRGPSLLGLLGVGLAMLALPACQLPANVLALGLPDGAPSRAAPARATFQVERPAGVPVVASQILVATPGPTPDAAPTQAPGAASPAPAPSATPTPRRGGSGGGGSGRPRPTPSPTATPVPTQNTLDAGPAVIGGNVRDVLSGGAVVPDVGVTVVAAADATKRAVVVTGVDGLWHVSGLAYGTYLVSAEKAGWTGAPAPVEVVVYPTSPTLVTINFALSRP